MTKGIESVHFKAFRSLVTDFPDGEVWHEDAPDFWVHTTTHVLGIEHCQVLISDNDKPPPQAIESQTDDIISIAQEHAELRGMPAVQVNFLFGHYSPLRKRQRIDLARAIARSVHDAVTQMDVQPFNSKVIYRPNVPDQLTNARIVILKQGARHFWRCNRSGWAVEDCRELFQKSIDEKSKRFAAYMDNCQECWLLMVADIKPSSFIHPNPETIGHVFVSPFSRTCFMDLGEGHLHQLKTRHD
jgi:hypothetical protein